MIFYNDDDNYLKFVYEWNFESGGRIFVVGSESEGRFLTVKFRAGQEFEKVWLRVTKRGNRYTFSTSLDGKSFRTKRFPMADHTGLFKRDLPWGNGSVKRVGIFAKNGPSKGAPEINASFEFFEVRSVSRQADPEEQGVSAHAEEMNVESR